MHRIRWLIAGLMFVFLFTVYAIAGPRTEGPLDKVIQLLLLFPAVLCISWFVSSRLRKDLWLRALDLLSGIGTGTFLAGISVILLALTLLMAFGPLEGTAKGADEAAYLFQAKVYAAGELSAPLPSIADPARFFPSRHLLMERGMWFSLYTPTHALLMVPFVNQGLTGLMGPLEAVISLIGIFLLIRIWTDDRIARVSTLLLLLSPFFLFISSTHMAHNSSLMFVTWSLYFLSIYWKRDRFLLTVASGFLLGMAVTTKPYPILTWGIFLFAVLLFNGRKGLKALLGMLLGSILPLAGFMAANWYYTGHPLKTAYTLGAEMRGCSRFLGFGEDVYFFPVYGDYSHTVWRGVKNGFRQVASGATSLFGWPLLSLVPLLLSLREGLRDRRVLWLFALLLLNFLLLIPIPWHATLYGPRYFYALIPVVMLLSAVGLRSALLLARKRWSDRGGSFVFLLLAGLFGISVLLYIPEEIRFKSGPWLNIDSEPWELAQDYVELPAVVFMEASDHGYPHVLSGTNHNSPFLDSEIVFCAHQTADEDLEFMELFPGRESYLYWVDESGSHMEPWTRNLTEERTPSRNLHTDYAPGLVTGEQLP